MQHTLPMRHNITFPRKAWWSALLMALVLGCLVRLDSTTTSSTSVSIPIGPWRLSLAGIISAVIALCALLVFILNLAWNFERLWYVPFIRRWGLSFATGIGAMRPRLVDSGIIRILVLLILASSIVVLFHRVVYGNCLTAASFFGRDTVKGCISTASVSPSTGVQPSPTLNITLAAPATPTTPATEQAPWVFAFVVGALIELCRTISRARRRISVLDFKDFTGDSNMKAFVEGIPARLSSELSSIRDTHRKLSSSPFDVFELSASSTASVGGGRQDTPSPSYAIGGVGSSLSDLVSKDDTISIGSLKVSLTSILNIFAGALRGPRLSCSMMYSGSAWLLEASLIGGGHNLSWRVTNADLKDDPLCDSTQPDEASVPSAMVRQMAMRIFTEMEQERLKCTEWRAVSEFTFGIQYIRDAKNDKQHDKE